MSEEVLFADPGYTWAVDNGSAAPDPWPAAEPVAAARAADGWLLRGRWILASEPSAPAMVRRLIKAALAGDAWADDLRPDVALIASELTANAWLHGLPPVEARLFAAQEAVRIEISDGSPTPPVCPPVGGQGLTGRGLGLVAALATRWGVDGAGVSGKVVWAELARGCADSGTAPIIDTSIDADPSAAGRASFNVRLGDVPTDLLLAAKNHVDGLVREFTLATTGAQAGSSGPLPTRLAELLRIVTTRFSEPRKAIKRQALAAAAAGLPRTTLDLALSPRSAVAGEAYLAALEEIESYARAARLLTLQSPPQHVAFRRWYVRALVDQLRALEGGGGPITTPSFEQYLLNTLDAEVLAGRATERAARLQRVTAALASATTAEQVADVVVSESVTALAASGGVLLVPADPGHAGQRGGQVLIPGAVGYGEELMAQLRAERLDDRLPAVDALRNGRAIWLESRAECYLRYPDLARLEPSVVAMCCLPLVVTRQVLGALRFSFDHSRLFDADERNFIEALAAQTALALERARLFTAERHARERAAFLTAASDLFASTLDSGRILERLLRLLVPRHSAAAASWRIPPHGISAAVPLDATVVTAATGGADVVRTQGVPPPGPVVAAAGRGAVVREPTTGTVAFPLIVAGRTAAVVALGRAGFADGSADGTADGTADDTAGSTADDASRPGRAPARLPGGTTFAAAAFPDTAFPDTAFAGTAGADTASEDEALVEELIRRASGAFGNALQFEREREIAVTLQRSLLPRRLPRVAGLTFAWRYLPGSAGALVGGDWYDVLALEGGRAALIIGDVMGHGLHAAATMGQLRATARAYALDSFRPAAILTALDAAMNRLEQASISTVTTAVLDPRRRVLTVASAGHLPPLLIPRRRRPWFPPVEPGPPLGAGVADYPELEVPLEPGSTVVLFTDGLVEDRSRPIDQGLELLRRHAAPGLSPERLCDGLLATLDRTHGNEDDVAMLAVSLTDAD
ncbi:ATP-binding SpoIIE family protein phosphatase [Frankia sp. R43]|uniref:ATP-binding SpoIIE family protein phosphatase n=1 Tax=Frankia sp. R43 TaxID=269536 RepID=UPI000AE324C2|nr:ATP-binding SpoIIE family protein phosphatase [Frankia sp. R43]